MRRALATIGFAFAVSSGALWIANACAPEFVVAVFSFRKHPDLPRTEFIDGRLGVLQPTFARSYWVIAYRYLKGIGLTPGEREQARSYYGDRAGGQWSRSQADVSGADWFAKWRAARERIRRPPAPKVSPTTKGQYLYQPESHDFALNCASDAFRNALRTLEDRRIRFGERSAAFQSWLSTQDIVFGNCDAEKPSIPPNAPANAPLLIRQDRAYQIAAANFYAGQYEAALAGFRAIADDPNSPWSLISRYLVARTILRMMPEKDPPAAMVSDLKTAADVILKDARYQPVQGMTLNLITRAEVRQRDEDYFRSLARLLSSRHQENGLREELWNYTDLYDSVIVGHDLNNLPYFVDQSKPPELLDKSRFRDADLTDWIFTIQSHDISDAAYAISKWRSTKSDTWLLAALIRSNGKQAAKEQLIAASEALGPDSPGYLTAAFHRNRLRIETGEKAEARHELDRVLASVALKGLPSSVNLFRHLRMLASPDFHDFVAFAVRKPVLLTTTEDEGEFPSAGTTWLTRELAPFRAQESRLDRDSTWILNHKTPFRMLEETALDGEMPPDLHRELLLTAFARGLMLNRDLTEITKALAASDPSFTAYATPLLEAASNEDRRFSAAFLILHHPEARPYLASGIPRQTAPGKIDNYRDNWWCAMDLDTPLDSRANIERFFGEDPIDSPANHDIPGFLSGKISSGAQGEFSRLWESGNATDFLGSIVLAYSKGHRNDPRVPEALHLVVKSGRYGCQGRETWRTIRSAFRELHLRYPQSPWAAKTPVWFKDW